MKCNLLLENESELWNPDPGENECPVFVIYTLLGKAVQKACGQTTVCRDGLMQLYTIVADITAGKGRADDCSLLEDLCNMILIDGDCPLSVKTAEAVMYSVHTYGEEWEKHCTRRLCGFGQCPGCYSLYIDPAICDGCGKCKEAAPEQTILGSPGMIHIIQKDTALKNEFFIHSCPLHAIKKAGAVKPKLPETPIPAGTFTGGGLRRKKVSRISH